MTFMANGKRSVLAILLPAVAGLLTAGPARALDENAGWSWLICPIREDVSLIYPDTQACYLGKDIDARNDIAYRIDFDLPYATYSSTTVYADNKPFAYLRESEYVVRDDRGRQVPNPYQPGNLVLTPRMQRKITMFVTPDYHACVSQGKDNCIATNSNAAFAQRNMIFQRVYYPNRTDPETGQPFSAAVIGRDVLAKGYARGDEIPALAHPG